MSSNEHDEHVQSSSKHILPETKIFRGSFSKISKSKLKANYVRGKKDWYSDVSSDFNKSIGEKSKVKNIPELLDWRRALIEDKPDIRQLQILTGSVSNLLYRKPSLEELIEKSYFPIVQFDSNGSLVSFTACNLYPNIPSVPSFFWDDWLSSTYKIIGANARNVLFIHYMVWRPQKENEFLRQLLETSFKEFLYLKYIIIVKPPRAKVPNFYKKYFVPILPKGLEKLELDSVQTLLVCLRTTIIHTLPIRTAFEEEFEFILSVMKNNFNGHNNKKNKFHFVDIVNILYQKEKRTLICEFEGHLVGIMILSLRFDLESLNEGFELAPFHGLRKQDPRDEESINSPTLMSRRSSIRLQDGPNLLISSELLINQMNWELMINKLGGTESLLETSSSSSSSSTDSEFSDMSFVRLPSLFEDPKSEISSKQIASPTSQVKSGIPTKFDNIKMTIRASVNGVPRIYLPKYYGKSNAFMIDFFAVDINKVDEKLSSFDFLEAAFKIVPDKEYCVLIIPTDLFSFPLLDLFIRIAPRPLSSFKQELYLCHKDSFSETSINVRNTKKEDLIALNNFFKQINESNVINKEIFNSCFKKHRKYKSFLLTSGETIVGFSMIDCGNTVEHFPLYFDVDDLRITDLHKTENQSIIKHLILNPVYYSQARFFVCEIMRLADVTCLYYTCNDLNKDQINMKTVLQDFYPVKPKRKTGLEPALPGFSVTGGKKFKEPQNLFLITTKLCSLKKVDINLIVVVVGASRTASSFLESLIFGPTSTFVNYKNLICVTPSKPGSDSAESDLNDMMFPIRDKFSTRYIKMLFLETYVDFIEGVMTEINRSEKYIVINNKAILKYDYLILTCGLQFQSPKLKGKEVSKNTCKKNFCKSSLFRYLNRTEPNKINPPKPPANMFVINTDNDAKNVIRGLQTLIHKIKNLNNINKKIIIYGHDLHAFLSIQTFLKLGIPGELMVFVEPFPSEEKTFTLFNDYSIDQAVLTSIRDCKLTYYAEYFLHDWAVGSDDLITSITFQSKYKQVIIPCLLFFPFVQKLVSEVTFNACNLAGLVYDGRLVINHNFRTNDKFIYAAGTFTKYSRRYYASDQDHQYFSSIEVGQKLANILRSKIDPTVEDETVEISDLVPRMRDPLLIYCELPGNFNYFVIRKPGKELDLETAYNFYNYGDVLTTGDCQMKDGLGYFRLHLSPEGFVQSISCYTKNKIDYVKLSALYGLHERLLNNLLMRYDLDLIPNFYEYFRQPWALALFHENFQGLRNCNYEEFKQKVSDADEDDFSEKVVKELVRNKWMSLSKSLKQKYEDHYQRSKIGNNIRQNVLDFLEVYSNDLKGYAHPNSLKDLL